MAEYDLVVRNGTLATASDVFRADIGVVDGRVVTIGAKVGAGRREIDAKGRIVTPGGIDSHCHIAQRSSMGVMTADDFFTATRSAACGGTTTVIPFAAQYRGMSLRQVVKDYHACADRKAAVDYAFHLIISDPTQQVTGQELPALIKDGYTSFKIYTTYDALKLDDRQILDVLSVARRERALVMVHAENHDVISWLSEKLLAAGHSAPRFHGMAHAPIAEREATSRAISLAELFDVFSSDHAGYRYDDPEGKMKHGRNAPFKKVANGVPGLEVRTALLFSEGVGKGRIDLPKFVALSATNAAKLYGLYPRKGTIAVGSDADLAIWDPDKEVTISQSMIHDAMDYTPYEGKKIKGWPITTLVRGEVVADAGEFVGSAGQGRFLKCDISPASRPLGRGVIAFDPATGSLG